MANVVVVGAGGHGCVVAEILMADQTDDVIGFVDDDPQRLGSSLLGRPVIAPLSGLGSVEHDAVIIAIGDNPTRARLLEALIASGEHVVSAVHPHAVVSPSVQVGRGIVVAAGAVINALAHLGDGVIVNSGATVDHHCVLEDYAHIAPGVHLAGGCHVGAGALVGIGAAVLPGRTIGRDAVVGAGSVVIDDVPPGVVAYGAPTRVVRPRGASIRATGAAGAR